jgi:hypothetical protein
MRKHFCRHLLSSCISMFLSDSYDARVKQTNLSFLVDASSHELAELIVDREDGVAVAASHRHDVEMFNLV